jgi:hypothetical protein
MASRVPLMILITVVSANSGKHVRLLSRALARNSEPFSIFFTGKGVQVLAGDWLDQIPENSEVVACAESWTQFSAEACPVTEGSQTDHSRLAAQATHLVSL